MYWESYHDFVVYAICIADAAPGRDGGGGAARFFGILAVGVLNEP